MRCESRFISAQAASIKRRALICDFSDIPECFWARLVSCGKYKENPCLNGRFSRSLYTQWTIAQQLNYIHKGLCVAYDAQRVDKSGGTTHGRPFVVDKGGRQNRVRGMELYGVFAGPTRFLFTAPDSKTALCKVTKGLAGKSVFEPYLLTV